MYVINITIQKGAVGKTITAVTLANELALAGQRTLLMAPIGLYQF